MDRFQKAVNPNLTLALRWENYRLCCYYEPYKLRH